VLPGFYPDPSVCRVGEWFYLVTSSFEYFPGVPLFKSKDLVNWQQIGHCLTRESQLPLDKVRKSGGIYAPTIRHHEGIFYMVTTHVDYGGNFYVTTNDIEGEWSDPIWVDIGGIDPTLFFDLSGKAYIVTNEGTDGTFGHIVLAEIDIDTGKLLTQTKELWKGTGGQYIEAPHIYLKDGYYYLMVAEGGTSYGHMETIARSKSIWGPYESCPNNPILTHREACDEPIQATGHGDLVQDGYNDWWILFLGIRPSQGGFHHLGRETFLAPVTWDENGWPVVNEGKNVALLIDSDRALELHPLITPSHRDNFDKPALNDQWNFIRNPTRECYSLNKENGGITLTGTDVLLSDVDSPTFIGRRQQQFECTASASMNINLTGNYRAGITVFYSDEHHYEIAVVSKLGHYSIEVEKTVGDINTVVTKIDLNADDLAAHPIIVLTVTADRFNYKFGYSFDSELGDGNDTHYIATGRTQLISTEIALGKFTGAYFGLFVESANKAQVTFNWFDYIDSLMEC
jgi:alpha-N-arabinofuranosidase